ncbi:hypothetical protein FHS57_005116 [Runella defluvii]|uniref:Uncharacterized protein n=1 Tax=Runella defluvii TaxID=370973 RepID=A0A7W6ESU2_9BACT|nr:hypothetical protein [Runella defluvii]
MNKCHYTNDPKYGKVLIPHCWGVVISGDMTRCTCRDYPKTVAQFERKQFNELLQAKDKEIDNLEKENVRLNRIIKKLLNKKR